MIEEWRVSEAGVVAHLTAVVTSPGAGYSVRISACASGEQGPWRIVNGMSKCAKCLDYQRSADG